MKFTLALIVALLGVSLVAQTPAVQPKLSDALTLQAMSVALEDARDKLLLVQVQQQLQDRARARQEKMAQLEKDAGCQLEWQSNPVQCKAGQ